MFRSDTISSYTHIKKKLAMEYFNKENVSPKTNTAEIGSR